ncbi:OprO/OprP family phosphate-selective porin [Myxococcota bacterium]|nr:OprO/OprP family phosphate-selective porin [Myxococcota bacterium]
MRPSRGSVQASLRWQIAVIAVVSTAAGEARAQSSTSTVTTSSAAPSRSGPLLELEGLAEESVPQASTPAGEPKKEGVLGTLSERASANIDRTTLGGDAEFEFAAGHGEPMRFQAHRYVLFVHSRVTDRISTATEIEFEFAGSPLKKDGVLGAGEVLLEFAVVDWKLVDELVFRAGVILIPFGSYNLKHDSPTQDLTDRPIAYTTIVPTTWFETGAGFLGTIALGETQTLSYELYVVNGLDARIYDGMGLRAARGSHFEDNNDDKAIVGRLAYNPLLGLEIGLAGYTGAYDTLNNRVNMANVDLFWRLGKLELQAEAVIAAIDAGYVQGFSASSTANTRDAVPETMAGFYAQANYHFTIPPLWSVFPEWLQESTFTGIVRYEGKDTNTALASAAGDRRRLTFGLNFRPVEAYVIKTDFQLESSGRDQLDAAPDLWTGEFWERSDFRFAASVALLF